MEVNSEASWMTPFVEYLKNDILPEAPEEAKKGEGEGGKVCHY